MDNEVTEVGEVVEVNGYIKDTDGKWIMTEESKAASLALYYSGRIAYENIERRAAIGRYSPTGEIIPFVPWPSTIKVVNV